MGDQATELPICTTCRRYLSVATIDDGKDDELCGICLGLWQSKENRATGNKEESNSFDRLEQAIATACEPYGGISSNRFATILNHRPTVTVCGEVYERYHWASKYLSSTGEATTPLKATPFSVFQQDLKQSINQQVQKILKKQKETKQSTPENGTDVLPMVNEEQQGYLSIHILCVPPKELKYPPRPTFSGNKRKRQGKRRMRPFTSQGGDPRLNLEARLQSEGYSWQSMADAEQSGVTKEQKPIDVQPMEFHVAAFRRPIFLYGYYTKSRRDVSQSPFVVDGGKTLGVTSVEEQICGPIIKQLGVSTRNNLPPPSTVQYGMCKFHASGREDMDVRMILRPNTQGRPFCVQVIDALRPITSLEQLQDFVRAINCEDKADGDGQDTEMMEADPRWYGRNPLGVGISNKFRLVPAAAFSGLQGDTETKVKHYGCHCWSEHELPLGEDGESSWKLPMEFPLAIQQPTPIRVLHRRANLTRDRQILAATATRLDAHHFRLELSTQAGTYVKEFVHGDLGRTTPSIASLLGCKTNLLLLDCEGIDVDDETDKK